MHQDKPKEIVVITSQDGIWREENVPLTGLGLLSLAAKFVGDKDPDIERGWSPFQWGRMYKEKMSPGFEESMKELRIVDDNIGNFARELNYLTDLLPSDPTKLPDIALILIEIQQRLDSIVEAGRELKPAKEKKLTDFYGRFHVRIPERLTTASKDDEKIAKAGLIGDFIEYIGKALYEYTDADTREMKRVVKHLLDTTNSTVKNINRTLDEMRSARKTGDIDKYIESVKFISKEQADFKREFSAVYDAYLKVPYEHALALEEEAKQEAAERGEVFKPSHEEVSIGADGKIDVIEVDDPPPEEVEPLEAAEDAEEPRGEFSPPPEGVEYSPQAMEPPTDSELPPTRIVDVEQAQLTDPETAPSTVHVPPPVGEEPVPPTQRSQQLGVSPKAPPSSEMDISPSQPIPQPKPESEPPYKMDPETGEWSDKPSKQQVGPRLRIEEVEPQLPPGLGAQIEKAMTKASHARFLDRLTKIADTENKYIVAAFMAKYSEELEDTNPKASAALLKAAQEISND